jgi:hypothetical protein
MSHKPVVPLASTPPYPAHPAPRSSTETETRAEEREQAVTEEGASSGVPKALGAAIGIGSAAIVAALLYASRRRA